MLTAIRELGDLVIAKEKKSALAVLVEDPNAAGNYNTVVTIDIDEKEGGFRFLGVNLEDYDSSKIGGYLYRRGAATSADFSPTARISGRPAGTVERKILGWFRVLNDKDIAIAANDRAFLEKLHALLAEHEEEIQARVVALRQEFPQREGLLLTLKFHRAGKSRYVGDLPVMVDIFQKLNEKRETRFAVKGQVCSLCGLEKDMVLGNIDTYKFYTTDKPGYIIGSFDRQKSWRNFPVCRNCKLSLEEGRKFLEENLTFRFCGLTYNLIPKFIAGTGAVADDVIDIFANSSKLISLKQSRIDSISGDEEDILAELQDLEDVLTLNFLFVEKELAAERIRLVIEDVFPSRLKEIFQAKEEVDTLFEENFTFGTLRQFFYKSEGDKRNPDLDKYFLDIIDRIFQNRRVNFQFILGFVMALIRERFIAERNFRSAVGDGLMVLAFCGRLQLFEMEEVKMEKRLFEEMFAKYGATFATPLKRGLFLLGSLTESLLRKQYQERGRSPFNKSLKSLKMNERDFKGLLPKVQNKLEEYESFDLGKRVMAREAANYLLLAGDNWKMSVDELNFYFAAGMNLYPAVAKLAYSSQAGGETKNGGMADGSD